MYGRILQRNRVLSALVLSPRIRLVPHICSMDLQFGFADRRPLSPRHPRSVRFGSIGRRVGAPDGLSRIASEDAAPQSDRVHADANADHVWAHEEPVYPGPILLSLDSGPEWHIGANDGSIPPGKRVLGVCSAYSRVAVYPICIPELGDGILPCS
eukprot:226299_1